VSWLIDAVPSSERARVESALAWCSALSLSGGSSLGADRFETVSMLLIEDGLVLLSTSNHESTRRIVARLAGPGSVLLPPGTHERIEALTDARMTLLPTSSNQRLLQIPAAASAIVEAVKDGLHDCRESLAHFASRRPADRVRLKLIQLARSYGKVGTEGLLLDIPLTHEGIIRHQRGRYQIAVPPEANAS
jgi:CRP-like cAMP-binding protein